MIAVLLQGAVLGLSAAMLPGPFQAFVLAEAARRGWRRTLPVAAAPLLSDGPVLLVVFLAVSRLPDVVLAGMRVGGGLFMGYLAYGAVRWLRHEAVHDEGSYGGVMRGAVMNLLNPNPWLFWGLVGAPIVVAAWHQTPWRAFAFLLAFYLTMVAVTAGLILVFGEAAGRGPRLRRALLTMAALALAGFGALQVAAGLRRLLA